MIATAAKTAGTYYPTAPGARTLADAKPLYIDGHKVSAVVDQDGTYTVFVGTEVAARGVLNGAEGNLNAFFADQATAVREAEAAPQKPVTVWIPVGKNEEIELTPAAAWEIARIYSDYLSLSRARETFAAMRVLRELRNLDHGLTDKEYRQVMHWVQAGGLNAK